MSLRSGGGRTVALAIQRVQFFSGLEAHGLSRRNAHFSPGAGIAANPGLAGPYAEHAKTAQFNAFPRCQRLLQALEYRVYGCFRLGPRQARPLNYMMNDVLLDQWGTSLQRFSNRFELIRVAVGTQSGIRSGLSIASRAPIGLTPTPMMLQVLRHLGN